MTTTAARLARRVGHALTGHHRRYVLADRRRHPAICFGCGATLPLPGDPVGLGPATLTAADTTRARSLA